MIDMSALVLDGRNGVLEFSKLWSNAQIGSSDNGCGGKVSAGVADSRWVMATWRCNFRTNPKANANSLHLRSQHVSNSRTGQLGLLLPQNDQH